MPQELTDKQSTEALGKPKRTSKPRRKKSKGLGDDIEKFTEATGIKKVVEKVSEITGKDCGCKKRKECLNRRFPRYDGMSKADQKIWVDVLKPKFQEGATVSLAYQETFIDVYQRTFGIRLKKTNCGKCVLENLEQLEKAYAISCDK